MANPIRNLIDGNLLQVDIVEDNRGIVGVIRTELNDKCLIVHPILYNPSKGRLKLMRKTCIQIMYRLKDEFGYIAFNLCTHNTRFIDMLFGNTVYKIGDHLEGVLYEYDMR
jgi:hypothetical protein